MDLSSWMPKGSILTSGLNLRGSHLCRTPSQSVRPPVDPQSQWFTLPPQTHLCSELWQSLTTLYCNPPALGRDSAHIIITCPLSDTHAQSIMSATGHTSPEFT